MENATENAIENASLAAKFELPFLPGDSPFTGSIIDVSQRRRKRPGQRRPSAPPVPLSNNDILHNVAGWANRPRSRLAPASRGNSTASHPVHSEQPPEVSSVIK